MRVWLSVGLRYYKTGVEVGCWLFELELPRSQHFFHFCSYFTLHRFLVDCGSQGVQVH